jgi:galactose-1-phosphate uridylyltransferase
MPLEYESCGDGLVWIKNPFTGFISYVVDYDKNRPIALDEWNAACMPGRNYEVRHIEQATAECPFCPGNEAKVLAELIRVRPHEVPGWDGDPSSPWLIRVFNNLFPRFPTMLSGGRNESYVVVEDPRHFAGPGVSPSNLLHTGALSAKHFARLFEVGAAVVERSLENTSIKSVVMRKNQGRQSGASQSHIHQQIIGSPVCLPAIDAELRALHSSPDLWQEIFALFDELGLSIDRNPRVVSYASPISTFPQSYDVVMLDYRGMVDQLDSEGLRLFASAIHRILRFLGPVPLEYEIHQAEGLPLHAHINVRWFPYSSLAGTVIVPRRLLHETEIIRRAMAGYR